MTSWAFALCLWGTSLTWRGSRTHLIWMCGVVPYGSATTTGIFYRAELALDCKFHLGELCREVPACGKDSHKAQEMTLLTEDVTSLSWKCQCLFFFFLTGRKKKIVTKLMQISEAALPLQLPAKECSGGVKAASLPCVGKGNMPPCSRAQAFPQRRQVCPSLQKYLLLWRWLWCCIPWSSFQQNK